MDPLADFRVMVHVSVASILTFCRAMFMSLRFHCVCRSVMVLALIAAPVSAQPSVEADNVAAFARLYGVARWFYPSDAAASLDWNRFAIDGVRRVRLARTPAQLESTLRALFEPLGPGLEIRTTLPAKRAVGARNADLIAWHYRGPGITEGVPGPYSAKRLNRSVSNAASPATNAIISQFLAADSLRGKEIRMRGKMRITTPDASGYAGLWLRVDRAPQVFGFFDNMQDRPVRDTTWREYVIEGPIASDAIRIAFGALSVGAMSADVDAIDISVRTGGGAWTPLVIPDANFEASPDGGRSAWGQSSLVGVTRQSTDAAQGERFARLAAGESAQRGQLRPLDSLETPIAGAVVDFALARGLHARVPLSLTDAEARTVTPELASLRTSLTSVATPAGRSDTDVRLADAVVAWNVFRHFYPYWGDIDVNWDARLHAQIQTALSAAETRNAHFDAVRMLVADLNDGHGSARDVAASRPQAWLPVQFRILADKLVVTASSDSTVPVGAVVTTIDGVPAASRVLRETQLASGTPQWKRTRAESALQMCTPTTTVTLAIEPTANTSVRDVRLPCARGMRVSVETRPDSISELQPGVWYVDLTRVQAAQLQPMLPTLAKARGVVFDVRGYPTDAGAAVLPHLMRTAEDSLDRWMHVPRFARPFGEVAAWQDLTWHLQPATPQITGQRIFLTDGRAISYAESVMGYVRDYKLGTIIGGTTAGANGNVAGFSVPGGFSIMFTGMRVTRHDGRSAYHTSGVAPDIPMVPTIEGIRAGRDELLARALDALRIRP